MKKCVFIVPYFGRFNNFFTIFLKTCEKNSDYDWIIFTDISVSIQLPTNVSVINITFNEIKALIRKKFDFTITLNTPYKFCDYKPAYGYIFEDYIRDYGFWAHCDMDVVFGNLNHFITDELLTAYDKIFCLGHMVLYRNTYENNRRFMLDCKGIPYYRTAFTTDDSVAFDEPWYERNIQSLFLEHGFKTYSEDFSANTRILPTRFVLTKYSKEMDGFVVEDYRRAVYLWENGNLFRIYIDNSTKELVKEEFIYMHFQQRKMEVPEELWEEAIFHIVPNAFLKPSFLNITKKNFYRIKNRYDNWHYLRIKWGNLKRRLALM